MRCVLVIQLMFFMMAGVIMADLVQIRTNQVRSATIAAFLIEMPPKNLSDVGI